MSTTYRPRILWSYEFDRMLNGSPGVARAWLESNPSITAEDKTRSSVILQLLHKLADAGVSDSVSAYDYIETDESKAAEAAYRAQEAARKERREANTVGCGND